MSRRVSNLIKLDERLVVCRAIQNNNEQWTIRLDDDGYVEFLKPLEYMYSETIIPEDRISKYEEKILEYIANFNSKRHESSKVVKVVTFPVVDVSIPEKSHTLFFKSKINAYEKYAIKYKTDSTMFLYGAPLNHINISKRKEKPSYNNKQTYTLEDCEELFKNSPLTNLYKIDGSNDEAVKKLINEKYGDLKSIYTDTPISRDDLIRKLYNEINSSIIMYEKLSGENYSKPIYKDALLCDGRYNTIKATLYSGKEMYVCISIKHNPFLSEYFCPEALFSNENLLWTMRQLLFNFIENYNASCETKENKIKRCSLVKTNVKIKSERVENGDTLIYEE